jgi:hypothetical protein
MATLPVCCEHAGFVDLYLPLLLCSCSSFTDINFSEARAKGQVLSLSSPSSPLISPLGRWDYSSNGSYPFTVCLMVYSISQCFNFYLKNEEKSSLTDLEVAGRIVYMNLKGIGLKSVEKIENRVP